MHIFRRKLTKILIVCAAGLLVIICLLLLCVRLVPEIVDAKVRQQDNAQTSREMAAAYQTLAPALLPLHATVKKPGTAECTPGYPSLYAHSCGVQVEVKFSDPLKVPQPADETVSQLIKLDDQLKQEGWVYNGNDFRSQNDKPVSTWAGILQTYGAPIAYQKGNCYFTLNVSVAVIYEQYRNNYPGGLYCYIDGGPTSVYKDQY